MTVEKFKALFLVTPQNMEELLDDSNVMSEKLLRSMQLAHIMVEIS